MLAWQGGSAKPLGGGQSPFLALAIGIKRFERRTRLVCRKDHDVPVSAEADEGAIAVAKAALRRSIAARRSALTETMRTASAAALADAFASWLRAADLGEARLVAVYLSVGTEPDTSTIIEGLRLRSIPMIAPVLRPDADLDWATLSEHPPVPGLRGTLEPTGQLLGVDAIAPADVVLVPALAVDESGHRLGRGGGSYDRALPRVRSGSRVLAVVHDDEVIDAVPAVAHDRCVDGVVTPSGVRIFGSH
jgi:5-formyltetrahydrofolate cyclo-ligase